jgi:cbb3-type cytochrome c oxidase subunit III
MHCKDFLKRSINRLLNTMFRRFFTAVLAAPLLVAFTLMLINTTATAGDAAAGKDKAKTCAACHGADGNSVNPLWPSLAGQNERYLADTLRAFKSGKRNDAIMAAQASLIADADIDDLAAYYATLTATLRTADPDLAAAGERLYRGGDKETGISACMACHGPSGRGNAPAGYPSLTGQHAPYTAKQLSDYQSGARTSDSGTQVMRNVSARLSQEQISAVAAYVQGLR